MQEALESVRPVHGVARRRRRAGRAGGGQWRGSGSRAAATAARPPRRRSSWRSSRRSTSTLPTSRPSRSRAATGAPGIDAEPDRHRAADRPGRVERRRRDAGRERQRRGSAPRPATGLPSWFPLDGVAQLEDGELTTAAAAGTPLVVANVDGTLLAYRDACADCSHPTRRRDADRGRARLRELRAPLLPARAPAARSTTTGCSSNRSPSSGRMARCGSPWRRERRERQQRKPSNGRRVLDGGWTLAAAPTSSAA